MQDVFFFVQVHEINKYRLYRYIKPYELPSKQFTTYIFRKWECKMVLHSGIELFFYLPGLYHTAIFRCSLLCISVRKSTSYFRSP